MSGRIRGVEVVVLVAVWGGLCGCGRAPVAPGPTEVTSAWVAQEVLLSNTGQRKDAEVARPKSATASLLIVAFKLAEADLAKRENGMTEFDPKAFVLQGASGSVTGELICPPSEPGLPAGFASEWGARPTFDEQRRAAVSVAFAVQPAQLAPPFTVSVRGGAPLSVTVGSTAPEGAWSGEPVPNPWAP